MKTASLCRICGSEGSNPSWTARYMKGKRAAEFVYFQCKVCGCLQIRDIPPNLSEYYMDDYYSFERVSGRKLKDTALKRPLRRLSALIGTSKGIGKLIGQAFSMPVHHEWFRRANVSFSSRILDAGCGSASRLVRIWKEGFTNSMGADPYIPEDIRYENGLEVKKAALDEIKGGASYDLIMMNHSFEHIPDQHRALCQIGRLLKPEGVALIRIPVAAYAWERYRTDWVQLMAPEHLYLHTEKSMSVLSNKNGFKVKEAVFDSLGFQFYGSELVKLGIPPTEHKKAVKRFPDAEIKRWEKEAKRLNSERRGDMACFYLSKQ